MAATIAAMEYLRLEENAEESTRSDEEVLAGSLEDPRHFELLLDRYQDAFLRKALSIIKDEAEAEDIVQEAFTKIYLNAKRFKKVEGATFKSWGYRILINTALTHYKKKKRDRTATVVLDTEFYESLPDTIDEVEKREVGDLVARGLSKIPEHMSKALALHFLENYSQAEIAKKEKGSVGAIKTRIHRAKEAFRKVTNNSSL